MNINFVFVNILTLDVFEKENLTCFLGRNIYRRA